MQDRAEKLSAESEEINGRLRLIGQLSDLSLLLYSWYIQNGHARNEKDRAEVDQIFKQELLEQVKSCDGFYEKLYRYQCYCWYGFIIQDFCCITGIVRNGLTFLIVHPK